MTDRFALAAEQLDREEQWVRLDNEGDEVIMLVDGYSMAESQFGEYPVITGTLKDGTPVRYAAMRTAVRNRIVDNPPQKGDILSVRYLGEKDNPKTGRTFNAYRVVILPAEAQPSSATEAATEVAW